MRSLRDREVACSASDRQGSTFESCVWRTVSSHSSHHPQEVLLAQRWPKARFNSFHFHLSRVCWDIPHKLVSFMYVCMYDCFISATGRPMGFIFAGRDIPDSAFSASSSAAVDYAPHRARIDKYFASPCSWTSGLFI